MKTLMSGKLYLIIMLSLMIICPAASALAGDGGPRLTITEDYYDAGKRRGGDVVRHDFRIENTGTQNLVVNKVATGCRCTVADYDKVVAPGQSGRITILLELSPKLAGRRIDQTVRVYTNDRQNLGARLVLSAEIMP